MRALCVGDLHLGAGSDYGREPGERLREQEQVWARALEIGRDLEADVVLFAGDAFHKARPSADEMLAFERPLLAHHDSEHGCPVVAIPGNHDYASATGGLGLEVFHEAGLLELAREPKTLNLFPGGVTVACLPWAPPTRVVAAAGGGDRDEIHRVAADTLTSVARGLREKAPGPMVLLTHFSIAPAVTPDGADVGLFREVVLEAGELGVLGFDTIVAGHIHRPQALVLSDEGSLGFFVGSPLPLTFGEAKCDHGVWILDLDAGGLAANTFVPIESRRFVTLDFTVRDERAWPPVLPETIGDAVVKVRIAATGEQARRLDVPALKRELIAAGAHKVWNVAVDVEREQRARVEGLDESLDELQALDLYLADRGINGDRGGRLRDLTEAYLTETRS